MSDLLVANLVTGFVGASVDEAALEGTCFLAKEGRVSPRWAASRALLSRVTASDAAIGDGAALTSLLPEFAGQTAGAAPRRATSAMQVS